MTKSKLHTVNAKKRRHTMYAYLFLAPAIIGLLVFSIWPILSSFNISFYEWIGFREKSFIGFENFVSVFQNERTIKAIANTFRITFIVLPISLFMSLITSSILNSRNLKYRSFFRILFYLPIITMPAAVALVFRYMFNYNFGVVNEILSWFNVEAIAWMTDPAVSWIVIVIMTIWSTIGFQIIILLAALQSVDRQIYEAADIDGANAVSKFFRITIPSISPTIFFLTVTGFIGIFQLFDTVYIMFNQSTGIESTRTIVYAFYQTAFVQSDRGLGTAIAVVIFFIILLVTIIQKLFEKKYVSY